MKKNDIDAIRERLEELDLNHREVRKSFTSQLAAEHNTLMLLEERQSDAANLDDYKHIGDDIKDTRDRIDFLNKKIAGLNTPALSEDEFRSIRDALNEEVANMESMAAPEIFEDLMILIQVFEAYAQRVDQLNTIYHYALRLANKPVCGLDRNISTIKEDHYDWYRTFMQMCLQHHDVIRSAKDMKERLKNETPWTENVVRMKKYAED